MKYAVKLGAQSANSGGKDRPICELTVHLTPQPVLTDSITWYKYYSLCPSRKLVRDAAFINVETASFGSQRTPVAYPESVVK
jgi:hypothetical protein